MKNKFLLAAILTGAFLLSSSAIIPAANASPPEEDPYKKVIESFDPAMVAKYGDQIKSRSKEIESDAKESEGNQNYTDSAKNTQVIKKLSTDTQLEDIEEAKEKYDGVVSELGTNTVNQVKNINTTSGDPECRKKVNQYNAKLMEAARNSNPLESGSSEAGPVSFVNQFFKIDPKTGDVSYELPAGTSDECKEAMSGIVNNTVAESQKLKEVKSELLNEASKEKIEEHRIKMEERAKEIEKNRDIDNSDMSPEDQAKALADATTSESIEETKNRSQFGDIEFETGYMGSEDKGGGEQGGESGEEGGGGDKN